MAHNCALTPAQKQMTSENSRSVRLTKFLGILLTRTAGHHRDSYVSITCARRTLSKVRSGPGPGEFWRTWTGKCGPGLDRVRHVEKFFSQEKQEHHAQLIIILTQVGNGMGKPTGISHCTCTCTHTCDPC